MFTIYRGRLLSSQHIFETKESTLSAQCTSNGAKSLDSRKKTYTVKRPLTDIGYLSSN